jgi:hypothetical protein
MSADHAMQTAIRGRLVSTSAVTGLVPADHIRDSNALPDIDPCIIIGEGQSVDEGRIDRKATRVFSTLHVWKKEPGLVGVKDIAWAVRQAVHGAQIVATGYQVGLCYVSSMRYLRDPDGKTAHGIVTVESLLTEVD